jgi:hypothetical protein
VLDVAGRIVRTLYDAPSNQDRLEVFWDFNDDEGQSVGEGVYFVVLEAPNGRRSVRTVRMK